jgi:hypothetical protein
MSAILFSIPGGPQCWIVFRYRTEYFVLIVCFVKGLNHAPACESPSKNIVLGFDIVRSGLRHSLTGESVALLQGYFSGIGAGFILNNYSTRLFSSRDNRSLALTKTTQVKMETAKPDIANVVLSFSFATVRSIVVLEINARRSVIAISSILIGVDVPIEYFAITSKGQW